MTDMKRRWGDFEFTVGVLTASAIAELDAKTSGQGAAKAFRTFAFQRLAAASDPSPRLPTTPISAHGRELDVSFEVRDDGIWARFQLKGRSALLGNAGREARLVSVNGAIDTRFRFGKDGSAICVLANRDEVRDGLQDFAVHVMSDDGAGDDR